MSAARRSVALLGRSAVKLPGPVPTRFARQLVTAVPLLRERPNRLPPGYIRPHRRTRRAPGTNISQDAVSGFTTPASASSSSVAVPSDPQGVLTESHAAYDLLAHDALIVVRQIEMLNIFMGFEQANRYSIQTKEGEVVGFLAEEEISFTGMLSRQFLRTHRPFRAVIMDRNGQPILWIRRPFQFINSRIFVQASQGEGGRLVGEAQQQWHPWRRKYNVFQARDEETYRQFAKIDSGLLAWDFWLRDKDDRLVASINRNFAGFGRELFTDTGQYVIRFDAAGTELQVPSGSDVTVQGQTLVLPEGDEAALTLDQRAMALATAVSIDFDYFSRHSGAGGMGLPFMLYGGGGSDLQAGQSDAGAAAGAAGAAGAGMAGGSPQSEDEQVYGRQPESSTPATGWAQEPQDWDQLAQNEMPGGFEDGGFGDELMDDPFGEEVEGDSGGGWGDWGDFGDSS